jgi:hypothetical protein
MQETSLANLKTKARDIVSEYLRARLRDSEEVVAVDSDGPDRYMVRIAGQSKDFLTIWFDIGDRTLQYECYFMPDPEENHESLYRYLLMKNGEMYGCRFSLASDHDIFITGQIPLEAVSEDEIDRIVGSIYHYTDAWFKPALRIGFASYFERRRREGDNADTSDEGPPERIERSL